jgi:hypothetical protein
MSAEEQGFNLNNDKFRQEHFLRTLTGLPSRVPVPAGMKPFDLAAALAGKPVVTGSGKSVTQIRLFEGIKYGYPLVGVLNPDMIVITRGADGSAMYSESQDLFMKVETKEVYLNVYYTSSGYVDTYSYSSEEEADFANSKSGRKRISIDGKAVKITVEA